MMFFVNKNHIPVNVEELEKEVETLEKYIEVAREKNLPCLPELETKLAMYKQILKK